MTPEFVRFISDRIGELSAPPDEVHFNYGEHCELRWYEERESE